MIDRVLRTYVSAVALARADADAARAALGKYSQTDDREVLDESYRYYRDLWGRPDFRVSLEAVHAMLGLIDAPGAATARSEDFVDNRFIDELHDFRVRARVGGAELAHGAAARGGKL